MVLCLLPAAMDEASSERPAARSETLTASRHKDAEGLGPDVACETWVEAVGLPVWGV